MRPAGDELLQVERLIVGQTIRYEANSPLRNFANAPRKRQHFKNIIVPDEWLFNNSICSSISP
jgi:hypothetical protein